MYYTKKSITGEIRLDELDLSTISNTDSLIHRCGMIVTVKVWARYPNAKALVVFMYHLWDENFRNRMAKIISVPKRQVKCALMGDIRKIRHLIIHKNSVVPQNFSAKIEFLSQIWDLEPGELIITEKMIHSLMEQINAIRVQINSST